MPTKLGFYNIKDEVVEYAFSFLYFQNKFHWCNIGSKYVSLLDCASKLTLYQKYLSQNQPEQEFTKMIKPVNIISLNWYVREIISEDHWAINQN